MATQRGTVCTISAPSGAGKTSLVKALLERDEQLQVSVSHTTRPMRAGEIDGVNYHFVSDSEFRAMTAQQAFVEYAEVFGHWYGTSAEAINTARADNTDIILEIDWQGAEQIKAVWPEACAIFILPPSHRTLEQRLEGRGQDSPAVIQQRLAEAEQEISHYTIADYLVVNDVFEDALSGIRNIIGAERLRTDRQAIALQALLCDLMPSTALRNPE